MIDPSQPIEIRSQVLPGRYDAVLDFGSGCGRIAQRIILQSSQLRRCLGVNLHLNMIEWCRESLNIAAPNFEFKHHDVTKLSFNSGPDKPSVLPLPAEDGAFNLVVAWSIFTQTTESQTEHYLPEVARVLQPGGAFVLTWFVFEKKFFPMMKDFQSALYINEHDPTNAPIFDRQWLKRTWNALGLKVVWAEPPGIRGYQWLLHMAHVGDPRSEIELP